MNLTIYVLSIKQKSFLLNIDMKKTIDKSRFIEPKRTTMAEIHYRNELEEYFKYSIGSNVEKLQNFSKYVPVQDLRKFICRYELFKKILDVQGSIIECGVQFGGGLMTWATLSELFEPLNHQRNIIGFDTFAGFSKLSKYDKQKISIHSKKGGLMINSYNDIQKCISLYDSNRVLRHIQKIKIIKGDANYTIPTYLKNNIQTVVSLLYLDFDVYGPTMTAIKNFIPRMPKGAIIAFDELNHEVWPGETVAVIKSIGLSSLRIKRFPFGSTVSYAIIE